MGTDPSTLALSETAEALRSGNLSANKLTEYCIGRRNDAVHAYKSWRPDVAMDMATLADQAFADHRELGALQGIPISLKDLYAVREIETYAGSPRLLLDAFQRDGPLVEKLRRQGAVFTGKTHTVEFAFDGLGVNSHWGTPAEPLGHRRSQSPRGFQQRCGRQPDRRLGNSCVWVGHSRFCSHSGFADRYRWIENDPRPLASGRNLSFKPDARHLWLIGPNRHRYALCICSN